MMSPVLLGLRFGFEAAVFTMWLLPSNRVVVLQPVLRRIVAVGSLSYQERFSEVAGGALNSFA